MLPHTTPPKPVFKISVCAVDFVSTFFPHSEGLGYDVDVVTSYWPDITALVQLWSKRGCVEIYSDHTDRLYGRAKDTNSKPGSSPWYVGLYHARLLKTANDPLLVFTIEPEEENGDIRNVLVPQFIIHHDDLFGELGKQKNDKPTMKALRERNSKLITRR